MPYFERKPWAETAQASTAHMPEVNETAIADMARAVLSQEGGGHALLDGPYRVKAPVAPGGDGHLSLEFAADAQGDAMTLDLIPGDLVNRAGDRIPAHAVTLSPSSVTVKPGGQQTVRVSIRVPMTAAPGLYAGRIIGQGGEPRTLLIELNVG